MDEGSGLRDGDVVRLVGAPASGGPDGPSVLKGVAVNPFSSSQRRIVPAEMVDGWGFEVKIEVDCVDEGGK